MSAWLDPKLARDLIDKVANHSPDRSTKVGCVIIDDDCRPVLSACNSFPQRVAGTEARHERPAKYLFTEHAERRVIYRAAREGISLRGLRILLPGIPCADCARGIIECDLAEVLTFADGMDPRWAESQGAALEMLAEAGITVTRLVG